MAKQKKKVTTATKQHNAAPSTATPPPAGVVQQPLDYRLIVHATDFGRSTLKSPLLDKLMHPQATAPIIIMSYIHDPDRQDGNIIIDAFQITSVLDYLRYQADVRAVLEREISAFFARSEPNVKIPKGAAMWRKVEIYSIYFGRKTVITRERFQAMQRLLPKLKDSAFASMAAGEDQPETRSSFQVFVKGPWRNEHEHYARFRDGKFVEFTIQ